MYSSVHLYIAIATLFGLNLEVDFETFDISLSDLKRDNLHSKHDLISLLYVPKSSSTSEPGFYLWDQFLDKTMPRRSRRRGLSTSKETAKRRRQNAELEAGKFPINKVLHYNSFHSILINANIYSRAGSCFV